jgi:branched-chain amino acid transport system substrate-binding protein
MAVTAGCGTNKTESNGGGGGNCDTSKGTLVIGMVAPLSGGLSALGLGMKNSADLAVKQANNKCAVKGYKMALQAEDDQATPQVGTQAATKLASGDSIVGVIGTLNSSVAQAVQPVLAQSKVVMVSPGNTNPALTRGNNFATAPARQFPNYFRVCATDDLQGPFAAQYMTTEAGKKNIAVITDGKTYGDGLATEFKKQAELNGAKIVASEKVGEKDTDFAGVVSKVKPLNPDAVYYGGEYPAAGPLSKQMKDNGLDVPLMGGDGIYDKKFIDLGGKTGDLATSVGAPATKLPSAKAFIDAYKAGGYKEDFSAYGAFAYDSANAIIGGLSGVLNGGSWSKDKRDALISSLGTYSGDGATGTVKFDQYGDSTNKLLTVYKVDNGDWKDVKTGTFEKK